MRAVRVVLVVPCYNEEQRLDAEAFLSFLRDASSEGVEFLFVNDGSRDGTLKRLESLAGSDPARISVLDLPRNSGKAEAVRLGMVKALEKQPQAVGFWDADLATPLTELPSLIEVLASRPAVEMVFAARVRLLGREISRRPSRHYVGRVGATLISSSLGLAVYDTQCGAKLFRVNPTIEEVFSTPFLSRWIFDVEILARFIRRRGRDAAAAATVELPIRVWHDVKGSKVGPGDFLKALRDLWKIRKTYK